MRSAVGAGPSDVPLTACSRSALDLRMGLVGLADREEGRRAVSGLESVPIIEAGLRPFQPLSSVPDAPAFLADRFCPHMGGFFGPPTACDVP